MLTSFEVLQSESFSGAGSDWSLPPSVFLLLVSDGSGRLLDLDGMFVALDRLAATLLLECLRHSTDFAVESTAARFGIEPDVVREDLNGILKRLASESLLIRSKHEKRRRRVLRFSAARAVMSLSRCLPSAWKRRTRYWLNLIFWMVRLIGFGSTIEMLRLEFSPDRTPTGAELDLSEVEQIRQSIARDSASSWLSLTCKEKALSAFVLARSHGVSASLILGVDLYPFRTHCWCLSSNHILSDDPQECATYVPAISFDHPVSAPAAVS